MISVGWSLRSMDTVHDKDKVIKKLAAKTRPGSVVLFHDTNEHILSIIKEYFVWLKDNEFKIVSLEQMFEINAYETE
jgi:inorganic pyrophosphatase